MSTRRVAVALCLVALGRAAHADDPSTMDAKAHYAQGQKQFDAGDYLAAAAEFEAAYALDPDPVYLYNTAQAYRLGSACARAADYYRRFLAVVPNPPNLDKVQHYLGDLDACVKAESESREPAPPPPIPAAPVAPPPPAAPAPSPRLLEVHHPLPLALAIAGGGVVALAVGGVLTHDVSALEGYSAALCPPGMICDWDAGKQARANDLQSRGRRDTALEISAYALGGAALVASGLVYALTGQETIVIAPIAGGAAIGRSFTF